MSRQTTAQNWNLHGLEWLLDDFAIRMQHHTRAVLASRDGLAGSSTGLDDAARDRLAAAASSLFNLGATAVDAAGSDLDEDVRQLAVEQKNCLLFIMAAGRGSLLAVATDPTDDPAHAGRVGYEMGLLIEQVGEHLATPDRDRAVPSAEGS
ncbi:roadblock/LC7 domain-containing protein [Streptomyces sp. NPDC001889]